MIIDGQGGKIGRSIAEAVLKELPGVEVDLIALDGATLVFCEVKTAERPDAHPAEWVKEGQMRRYVRAAESYVARHALYDRDVRFDVMEICGGEVRHIRGAFDASR